MIAAYLVNILTAYIKVCMYIIHTFLFKINHLAHFRFKISVRFAYSSHSENRICMCIKILFISNKIFGHFTFKNSGPFRLCIVKTDKYRLARLDWMRKGAYGQPNFDSVPFAWRPLHRGTWWHKYTSLFRYHQYHTVFQVRTCACYKDLNNNKKLRGQSYRANALEFLSQQRTYWFSMLDLFHQVKEYK